MSAPPIAGRPESPDDTVIDAAGKFILPRLIASHLPHIAAPGAHDERESILRARGLHLVCGAGDRRVYAPGGHQHRRPRTANGSPKCDGARKRVEGGTPGRPADGRRRGGTTSALRRAFFDPILPRPLEETRNDAARAVIMHTRDEFIRETASSANAGSPDQDRDST